MNFDFSTNDWIALGPLLTLLGGALVLLLVESFFPMLSKRASSVLASLTIVIAIFMAWNAPVSSHPFLTPWLRFDALAKFFTLFFLWIGLAVVFLSSAFFQRFNPERGEYYFLLLSSLFGLVLIGASADFLTIFLGLETLSIALYILCCYMKQWPISQEASLKYFLMGALAASFLIYGIALVYGAIGTTRFDALLGSYQAIASGQAKALFLSGIALITLGFAFKAAIVPFHIWAPDVYDGAPTPVTAFMAVGTKVGAFAAFIVIFLISLRGFDPIWNEAVSLLAYPTLIYANFVALRQLQLRRFFAYSGISHAGFLLIPLAAATPDALSAMLFYLIIYALATFGAFAVLAILDERMDGVFIHDLNGLFKRSPALAIVFALSLLTLAGIPPTAGFFAKFYIFKVAYEAGYFGLVSVGLLMTILSAYYYLRIVAVLFTEKPESNLAPKSTFATSILAFIIGIAIIAISVYPTFIL